MVKQQIMGLVAGLALMLVLLGVIALGISAHISTATAVAHVTTAQHVLADVADPPPGH